MIDALLSFELPTRKEIDAAQMALWTREGKSYTYSPSDGPRLVPGRTGQEVAVVADQLVQGVAP